MHPQRLIMTGFDRNWRVGAAALAALLGPLMMAPRPAAAALTIDITQGNLEPLRVAIPEFLARTDEERKYAEDIATVLKNNLERSGLFLSIDRQAYIERQSEIDLRPRFPDWRVIGTQVLVNGRIQLQASGLMLVDFRVWDVSGEEQLLGLQLEIDPRNWRRIAHRVTDRIYQRLTGEAGYFDSRIVFISETGPKGARAKRLTIMDQDGANPSYLTNGSYLVLTPRYSPSAQQITYLSYEEGRPKVFLYNIANGRREALGQFEGMTFAPRFTPDGRGVIMSLESAGNSDIYTMDLNTRALTRLTSGPDIDTSPSMSPDGRQIVFTSDRAGDPQLYVMNADGSDVRRVSQGEGRYSTPVWSPRGDRIAFTKQIGGRFQIGVMRIDGSGEITLAESWSAEGPTWSPNGRVVVFFRQSAPNAESELWSVDLTGRNLRRVVTPVSASDPAWSPLLQ